MCPRDALVHETHTVTSNILPWPFSGLTAHVRPSSIPEGMKIMGIHSIDSYSTGHDMKIGGRDVTRAHTNFRRSTLGEPK